MNKNPNMPPQPAYPPPAHPPPAYYAATYQPGTTIITTQPSIIPGVVAVSTGPPVGPQPNRLNCPSCNADIITRVDYKATTGTHCMAFLLCLIFIPCGLIPYAMDSCKNANHYCPSCGSYIGTYLR